MSRTPKPAIALLAGLLSFLGLVATSTGLPSDSQQELNLSSESADFDLKRGVAVYQGNVKLTQGSLRIESDELVVHRKDDVIERVIATGSPAVFEQQPEIDQAPIVASGRRIEYELESEVERVAVIDEARLQQGGVVSTCERIEFNLTESTARMMGSCVTERPALKDEESNADQGS